MVTVAILMTMTVIQATEEITDTARMRVTVVTSMIRVTHPEKG